MDARAQDDHHRVLAAPRRHEAEGLEQQGRVVLDRPHRVGAEELGEHAAQEIAVLQHVGDPARDAAVVLEDEVLAPVVADDVGADHVGEDLPGRDHPEELPLVLLAREDEIRGHDPVLDALLVLVDVGEEEVQRGDALDEAVLEALPLRGGNDAGDEIEREDALEPVFLSVDREGDALAAQGELLEALAPLHVLLGEGLEDGDEGLVVGARASAGIEHLVEAALGRDPLHRRVASSEA